MKIMARSLLVLLAVLAAPLAAPAQVAAEEARLGVDDQLRIRIYQWPEISGEYVVGVGGVVSLPLVGSVPAGGATTDELAGRIAEALREKARLTETPNAAVEVVAYRPFYIMGDVENPGAFPYRPGLLVLNAVSLAGGYYRKADVPGMRAERDAISATGDRRVITDQIARTAVRIARLEAELSGEPDFEAPRTTTVIEDPAAIVAQERRLMESRAEAEALKLAAIEREREALDQRLDLIRAQIGERQTELSQIAERIESVERLAEKKLVSNVELLSLLSQAANVRREEKELEVQILDTSERLRGLDEQKDELANSRREAILSELRTAEAQQGDLENQLWKAQQLYVEAASAQGGATDGIAELTRRFTLVRVVDGVPTKQVVEETTAVRPGDIVEVATIAPALAPSQ